MLSLSYTCVIGDSSLKIVFESSNVTSSSVFELEHLKSICRQEDTLVRKHDTFTEFCVIDKSDTRGPEGTSNCCPSWSLGYAVALLNGKSSCENITGEDVKTTKGILNRCSEFYNSGRLTSCVTSVGSCRDIPTECSANDVVHTIFHYLTPVQFARNVQTGDFELEYTVSFSPHSFCERGSCEETAHVIYRDNFLDLGKSDDKVTRIVGLDFGIKSYLFNELVASDFLYLAIGVLLVFVIIWIYTHSLLLAIGSMTNMLFSVVLTYFLYLVVFKIPFSLSSICPASCSYSASEQTTRLYTWTSGEQPERPTDRKEGKQFAYLRKRPATQ